MLSPYVELIERDTAFSTRETRPIGMCKALRINSGVIVSRISRAHPRVVLHDCWQRPQPIVVDPTNLTSQGRWLFDHSSPFRTATVQATPNATDPRERGGGMEIVMNFFTTTLRTRSLVPRIVRKLQRATWRRGFRFLPGRDSWTKMAGLAIASDHMGLDCEFER